MDKQLAQQNRELLACCKELRDALKIAAQVIADNGCAIQFLARCTSEGIPDGIGVRANVVIRKVESP